MNYFEKAIAVLNPQLAARRAYARLTLNQISMNYDAAKRTRRTEGFGRSRASADAAAGYGRRDVLAAAARDLARNAPFAARARNVIAANVVGDGIIPKISHDDLAIKDAGLAIVEAHLDSAAIHSGGRLNFYGLQRQIMASVVVDGEVLVVRRHMRLSAGLSVPLQIEVLEMDFLDATRDGVLVGGGWIEEGIEYGADGKRVAYWLHDEHPGAATLRGQSILGASKRVLARDVIHIFWQDRPGQNRGVSWFAPVMLQMNDLREYQDAQLVRQKIAGAFAGFLKRAPDGGPSGEARASLERIEPGAVYELDPGEEMTFPSLPSAGEFDPFVAAVLRSIAAGLGVTYEALSGDLSRVNFSSARMGRMEMDRNISAWQWLMIEPQFLRPFGEWLRQAWAVQHPELVTKIATAKIEWVPPHKIIVDPAREIPALKEAVRAGFTSRQAVVRGFGVDPETLLDEQVKDQRDADANKLIFDSDARYLTSAGVGQFSAPGPKSGPETSDANASEEEGLSANE